MPYLIDTDIVIDHFANIHEASHLLETLAPEGIAISIITYMEAYQGVTRSSHPHQAQQQFEAFLETVPVLPFSVAVAKRCAMLRETLKREGKRVKAQALDLINAAIAIEHQLTLVTRNTEDYKDILQLSFKAV
jgi:predicted nucleic acid-binding protein